MTTQLSHHINDTRKFRMETEQLSAQASVLRIYTDDAQPYTPLVSMFFHYKNPVEVVNILDHCVSNLRRSLNICQYCWDATEDLQLIRYFYEDESNEGKVCSDCREFMENSGAEIHPITETNAVS